MQEISEHLNCSVNKIVYWMQKHRINTRTRSEATYTKKHPKGDPFNIKKNLTPSDQKLFGLGIGLFLGEGHKRNQLAIRVANSEPKIIKIFMNFLVKICGVKARDISFYLMIFNNADPQKARKTWIKELGIKPTQIRGKNTILKPRGKGTYRHKQNNGVIILQYNNKKLREIIGRWIENLDKPL